MALVNHWIAIDETRRGAIGLTREDVLDALQGARLVAVGTYPVWDMSAAMVRGVLPLQFTLEQHRTCAPNLELLERGSW